MAGQLQPMSLRQLAFILSGPEMRGREGLCPHSWRQIFDSQRFDLSLCWIDLLPLLPLSLLLACGSWEAWSLRKAPVKRLSGWRGLGLYRLKLVSARIHAGRVRNEF